MLEKRLTSRLSNYWDFLRKTQPMPDIRFFNPGAIEDIWPYCFKVSVSGRAPHHVFQYDYMGPALIEVYGEDLNGNLAQEKTPEFPGMVLFKKFNEVVKEGNFLYDDGHFVTRHNQMIKYRACLLPFGPGEGKVTHIVVGLSFRVF